MRIFFKFIFVTFVVTTFAGCYNDEYLGNSSSSSEEPGSHDKDTIDSSRIGMIVTIDGKEGMITILNEKEVIIATQNEPSLYTYDEAVAIEHDNWRLPTKAEFEAFGKIKSTLNDTSFIWDFRKNALVFPLNLTNSADAVNIDYYWCSDTRGDQGYCLALYYGVATHVLMQIKSLDNKFNVRMVHKMDTAIIQ